MKTSFEFDPEEKSHVVRAGKDRYISLTNDPFSVLLPLPAPKMPSDAKVSRKENLDTVLKEALNKLPEGYQLQSEGNFGEHLRNAFMHQDVSQAEKFLKNLKSHFELVDLVFIYVPPCSDANMISNYLEDHDILTPKNISDLFDSHPMLKDYYTPGGVYIIKKGVTKLIRGLESIEKKSREVTYIEWGFQNGKLTPEEFKTNPIVQEVFNKRNISSVNKYTKKFKLKTYLWVPNVNELERPEVCVVRIGGDGHGKFVIEAGQHHPTSIDTVIRGVKVAHQYQKR